MFRVLKKGNQYQSLFPHSTCERVELGKGDTDYSINKMVEWITQHQNQTSKIAKLLEKSSLQQTCKSIHDFLYWHFQYKADAQDQLLRSPACAWKQRHDGIDCKSYSIIASCLLLNLDVNHYIKKVAYTTPGEYTHVYVIVPHNQQTNDLNDGYYMIDGTIDTMQEPNCIDEKNEYMSLSHFGLQRPQQHHYYNGALNGINLTDLKKLDLSSLSSLLNNLRCRVGNYGFSDNLLEQQLNKATSMVNLLVDSINKSIASNDLQQLTQDYTDLFGFSTSLYAGSTGVDAYGDWTYCTTRNLQAFQHAMRYFMDKVVPALTAYLDKYFVRTQTGSQNYTNAGLENQGYRYVEIENYVYNQQFPLYSFTLKPGITQLPAFEFTAPLIAATTADLNIQSYLNSLQTIIAVVHPNGGNNNPNGGNGTDNPNGGNVPDTKTSGTGIGTLIGVGAVGLLIKYLIFS